MLKALKCPNCSAQINTIDETTKKAFCPFCDSLITNVQELQDDFLKVDGVETQEELFDRAETYVELQEKTKAIELLLTYTEQYPSMYKGWKRLYELTLQDMDRETAAHECRLLGPEFIPRYVKNCGILKDNGNEMDFQIAETERWMDYVAALDEKIKAKEKQVNELKAEHEKLLAAEKEADAEYAKAVQDDESCLIPMAWTAGTIFVAVLVLFVAIETSKTILGPLFAILLDGLIIFLGFLTFVLRARKGPKAFEEFQKADLLLANKRTEMQNPIEELESLREDMVFATEVKNSFIIW